MADVKIYFPDHTSRVGYWNGVEWKDGDKVVEPVRWRPLLEQQQVA